PPLSSVPGIVADGHQTRKRALPAPGGARRGRRGARRARRGRVGGDRRRRRAPAILGAAGRFFRVEQVAEVLVARAGDGQLPAAFFEITVLVRLVGGLVRGVDLVDQLLLLRGQRRGALGAAVA